MIGFQYEGISAFYEYDFARRCAVSANPFSLLVQRKGTKRKDTPRLVRYRGYPRCPHSADLDVNSLTHSVRSDNVSIYPLHAPRLSIAKGDLAFDLAQILLRIFPLRRRRAPQRKSESPSCC
jgi:hypothetical protein